MSKLTGSLQFIIFLMVGAVCALIDIGTMELLILIGVAPLVAVTIGFICGLLANYLLHLRVTFRTQASYLLFTKYLSIVGINYLVTVLFVYTSLTFIGDALIGKLLSLPVIAVTGFLLSKYWAFK